MKSKIRVSNSKTGLERTDGTGDVAELPSLIVAVVDDVVGGDEVEEGEEVDDAVPLDEDVSICSPFLRSV